MGKSLLSAFAIVFLDNFGLSLAYVLFAPLILDPQYGFFPTDSTGKNVWLGILFGIFPLFLFFSAPFWGDVGDRWGRKRALTFTILGSTFGHLISAFAIWMQSYPFLLCARGIAGLFSGNISVCLAAISDMSPDAKIKARNFGLLTVFLGMGWILAMLLGGYLSDPKLAPFFNPTLPFYIATLLTFLGYLVVKFWFEETHAHKPHLHFDWLKSIHEIKTALRTRAMRPFLYVLFVWTLGWYFTFQWFAPVSLEQYRVSQETVSSYLVVLGFSWIIGGVLLNPLLVKKISSFHLSLFSVLFVALFILLSGLSTHYVFFALFFWIAALAAPISLSNLLNIVSLSAPSDIQGKAMGFSQSLQASAAILSPFIGGELTNFSIRAIFPISALLLFLSFCLLVRRRPM